MEGKKATSQDAKAAGLKAVSEGGSVNQGLIDALQGYVQECFEAKKTTGE